MHTLQASVASLALLLAGSSALAQHAGYVMFGEPNPAAAEVAPQRQAVHPITAPYFHEDSFVTTDVRAWYLYHDFSTSTIGGNVQVAALQLRVALTDQLQFVAYKDGYAWHENDVTSSDGVMDLAAGLKWNFLQDWENDLHAAVGAGYQFALGSEDELQDDQELRL